MKEIKQIEFLKDSIFIEIEKFKRGLNVNLSEAIKRSQFINTIKCISMAIFSMTTTEEAIMIF